VGSEVEMKFVQEKKTEGADHSEGIKKSPH